MFVKYMAIPNRLRVVRLQTDKGGEYKSIEFRDYFRSRGIIGEVTVSTTPQGMLFLSGRAARWKLWFGAYLWASSLPRSLRGELLNTVAEFANSSPHSGFDSKMPYLKFHARQAEMSPVWTIGTRAFVLTLNIS